MNTLETIISHFGGKAELAKALGVTRSAVTLWKTAIPKGRAYQIQIVTNGKFQAAEILSRSDHIDFHNEEE